MSITPRLWTGLLSLGALACGSAPNDAGFGTASGGRGGADASTGGSASAPPMPTGTPTGIPTSTAVPTTTAIPTTTAVPTTTAIPTTTVPTTTSSVEPPPPPPPPPVPPPVVTGCVTDVTAGVHEFPCAGTTDIVSVPEQCLTTACGVIVDVHGGSMSADMEDKNTNLRALGVQHGYVVIQPNALPSPFLGGARVFVAGEDDARVLEILTDVIAAFHIDEDRVHMTGFSEGGFMTWRWLCAHSDLLASVAPAAAAWQCNTLPITPEIGCEFTGAAVPARNIPILYMQGMTDALMNPQCVMTWLETHVYPTLGLGPGQLVASDAKYERSLMLDPAGVPFEIIQHQYATDSQFFGVAIVGHCYPGSMDFAATLPGQLMGFGCKDPDVAFHWGEEVIEFFQAHPRQ